MTQPIDLDARRRERRQDRIDAALMVAVYEARRSARLQALGREEVPPMTSLGRELLARARARSSAQSG